MFRLTLGMILSLALLFAGCVASQTGAPASGLEGQVLIGPTCPVAQAGLICPDQPYQATITVLDEIGQRVQQVQSDPNGYFKVALRPGRYILHPESADAVAHAPEQAVTVRLGQFTRVAITYDSGLR